MSAAPYVAERQVEYWTSVRIEKAFSAAGYSVVAAPLTQLTEHRAPSDFVFYASDLNKVFGLQYKALYHNSADHWPISEQQHRTLQTFGCMYYALSTIRSMDQRDEALSHLMLRSVDFPYQRALPLGEATGLVDWETFIAGVQSCEYGARVSTRDELLAALWPHSEPVPPEIYSVVDDVFLLNINRQELVRYSSSIQGEMHV